MFCNSELLEVFLNYFLMSQIIKSVTCSLNVYKQQQHLTVFI